ncbi:MAG TPA: hypothetical protein DCS93_05705 [Microscillaceae bacterium]|nr:hypothetical protein [Microscillaceae bacterium]
MNSIMLAEIILILLAIAGFALRIGLSVWGIPLLIIGFVGLAVVYLRRSFRQVRLNNQPEAAADRYFMPAYKLAHLLFALCMLGLLFKIMLWDANFLVLGVTLMLVFVLFVSLQVLKEKVFFKKLLVKSILIGTVALAFYQAPLATFINIYYRDHPAFAKVFIEYREDPKNEVKKKNYLEARKKLLNKHAK